MRHIELFSGIGGFRQAMKLLQKDEGVRFDCVAYSEIDKDAERTYKANFDTDGEIAIGDISSFVDEQDKINALPSFDLLTGGFPCQSFSMMGDQKGFNDARGTLFFRMLELIKKKMPPFLLLENVKNLRTHDHGNTFRVIINELEKLGYHVYADLFNSSDFDLAQTRNRIYIFAVYNKNIPPNFNFSYKNIYYHFHHLQAKSIWHQNNTIDVLEKNVSSKYYLSQKIKKTILSNGTGGYVANSEIDLKIARPLCATMAKMHRACQDNYFSQRFIDSNGTKAYSGGIDNSDTEAIRRLTPKEALAFQGFDETFWRNAVNAGLADSQLYKQAGNAVSVNVVYAILSYLSTSFNWR